MITNVSLATNPIKLPQYLDTVEVVELNHFYDDRGKFVFDQFIFWDHYPGQKVLVIRQWYLSKNGRKEYSEEDKLLNKQKAKEEYVKEFKISNEEAANIEADLWVPEWIGDPKFKKLQDFNRKKYFEVEEDHGMRIIYYKHDAETYTQYDPELVNREIVPKEERIPFKIIPPLNKPFILETPAENSNNGQ